MKYKKSSEIEKVERRISSAHQREEWQEGWLGGGVVVEQCN